MCPPIHPPVATATDGTVTRSKHGTRDMPPNSVRISLAPNACVSEKLPQHALRLVRKISNLLAGQGIEDRTTHRLRQFVA